MSKYSVTITEKGWSDEPVVKLVQPFDNFGSMNLWAKHWYKSLGLLRTPYKNAKGAIQFPKEYQTTKESFANILNWTGLEDFKGYTEQIFLEFYYRRIDKMLDWPRMYEKEIALLGVWGISIGGVQRQKQKYLYTQFWVRKLPDEMEGWR